MLTKKATRGASRPFIFSGHKHEKIHFASILIDGAKVDQSAAALLPASGALSWIQREYVRAVNV